MTYRVILPRTPAVCHGGAKQATSLDSGMAKEGRGGVYQEVR